jgi:hypothetical protein
MPAIPDQAEGGGSAGKIRLPEEEGIVGSAKDAAAAGETESQESMSAASDIQAGFVAGAAAADVAVSVASAAESAKQEAGPAAALGAVPGADQAKGIKDEIAQKGDALQGAKKAAEDAARKDEDSADIEE